MFEKVAQIISEHQDIGLELIKPESLILTDLGINSYEIVDLICRFEEEFGIEVSDRKIREFQKVEDIVLFLEQNA